MPIDVYSKMEKRGFTTESSYIPDAGDVWINKKTVDGDEYEVSTYSSSGKSSIDNIRGWVMIDPKGKI